MIIVRFITSFIFSILMIVLTVFFGLVCSTLPRFPNFACFLGQKYGAFILQLARYLCGIRYTIQGAENIPANNRFIIFSKHQSTWETLFLLSYFSLRLP